MEGQGRAGQGKARQGRVRQGKAEQGREVQNNALPGRETLCKLEHDRAGWGVEHMPILTQTPIQFELASMIG